MKERHGFTLIELLIVIAVISILASIAYPSYQSHMIKARRGDAQSELRKAQLKQSSLHILSPAYSTDKNKLGLIDNAYYTFTAVSASASTYLMKAVAKVDSTQIDDLSVCQSLFIDQNNTRSSDGSNNNEQCW